MTCSQPALTRRTQFGIKTQVDCETPVVLVAENLVPVYTDASVSFDVQVNDRTGLASNSLSNYADVMGRKLATITAKTELIGLVNATTPPIENEILITSGMVRGDVKKVAVESSANGDVPFGIQIENGSGTVGTLTAPVFDTEGVLYFESANDFLDTETISETQGSVDASAVSVSIKRAKISSIIGGSIREDELLISSGGGQVRAVRSTKNGDSYLYFKEISGTIANGETLTTRNKSLTILSTLEDVQQIPVTDSTIVYELRYGLTITGSISSTNGILAITYDGSEANLYVLGAVGYSATDVLTTTQITWTATDDSKAGGYKFSFISENQKQSTVSLNKDGVQRTIWNSACTFSVDAEANNIAFLNFTLTGTLLEEKTGDFPLLTAPDFELDPVAFQSADMKFLDEETSFSPVLKSIAFDIANNIVTRDDANSPTGTAGTLITSRNPSGSMSVEQVATSEWDYLSRFVSGRLAGTQYKFQNECGNSVWVLAPKTQYSDVSQGDNDGVLGNDISYGMKRGSGDDELFLVYLA